MKKTALLLLGLCSASVFSQFNITLSAQEGFVPKEVYIYTINGSKDILVSKQMKKNNQWSLKYPDHYMGMMKAYFPEINYSLNFISENKDVSIKINSTGDNISEVLYLDESNSAMNDLQDFQRKQQAILPVLHQMKGYYKKASPFASAIDQEIAHLSGKLPDVGKYPFVNFYTTNYNKFLSASENRPQPSQSDIVSFISNSNEMLESSTLLRPLLQRYLSGAGKTNIESAVDTLLKAVTLETPRGQTVMSELIELFDTYSMNALKDKYLGQAKNLKCTITDRLSSTIKINDANSVGATFTNYVFNNPVNTQAKSVHEVKADKKVIIFWSSSCSHCETELPQFIPYYQQMKSKSIQIIGLSLDVDQLTFGKKAKMYPWINDTELRGWSSSFAEVYNVHATPTYFILDKNNKIIAKPDHAADVLNNLGLK